MLTQKIGSILDRSREHWLFVPFFVLLILSFAYVFFIGEKGFLAYRMKTQQIDDLKAQLQGFNRQKDELTQKLAMLSNKDMAIQKFSKDFYLFQEKVRILKFRESNDEKAAATNEEESLVTTQKFYIIASTLLIAIVTFFFYRRNALQTNLERVRPFGLDEK